MNDSSDNTASHAARQSSNLDDTNSSPIRPFSVASMTRADFNVLSRGPRIGHRYILILALSLLIITMYSPTSIYDRLLNQYQLINDIDEAFSRRYYYAYRKEIEKEFKSEDWIISINLSPFGDVERNVNISLKDPILISPASALAWKRISSISSDSMIINDQLTRIAEGYGPTNILSVFPDVTTNEMLRWIDSVAKTPSKYDYYLITGENPNEIMDADIPIVNRRTANPTVLPKFVVYSYEIVDANYPTLIDFDNPVSLRESLTFLKEQRFDEKEVLLKTPTKYTRVARFLKVKEPEKTPLSIPFISIKLKGSNSYFAPGCEWPDFLGCDFRLKFSPRIAIDPTKPVTGILSIRDIEEFFKHGGPNILPIAPIKSGWIFPGGYYTEIDTSKIQLRPAANSAFGLGDKGVAEFLFYHFSSDKGIGLPVNPDQYIEELRKFVYRNGLQDEKFDDLRIHLEVRRSLDKKHLELFNIKMEYLQIRSVVCLLITIFLFHVWLGCRLLRKRISEICLAPTEQWVGLEPDWISRTYTTLSLLLFPILTIAIEAYKNFINFSVTLWTINEWVVLGALFGAFLFSPMIWLELKSCRMSDFHEEKDNFIFSSPVHSGPPISTASNNSQGYIKRGSIWIPENLWSQKT